MTFRHLGFIHQIVPNPTPKDGLSSLPGLSPSSLNFCMFLVLSLPYTLNPFHPKLGEPIQKIWISVSPHYILSDTQGQSLGPYYMGSSRLGGSLSPVCA